jgi:hypothetical protein
MARTGHRRAVPGRQRAVARAAPLRQADPRGGFSAAAGYGDRTDEESLDRARHDPYRDEPVSIERDAAPAARARGALRRAPGSSTYASRAAAEGAHIDHSGATRVTLPIGRAWRHIGGYRETAASSDHHVARPMFQSVREPGADYAPHGDSHFHRADKCRTASSGGSIGSRAWVAVFRDLRWPLRPAPRHAAAPAG